jgi:hypothetical protein
MKDEKMDVEFLVDIMKQTNQEAANNFDAQKEAAYRKDTEECNKASKSGCVSGRCPFICIIT